MAKAAVKEIFEALAHIKKIKLHGRKECIGEVFETK